MEFAYTRNIGYLLLVLSLSTPFNIMWQQITTEDFTLVMMAGLWQLVWVSDYPLSFVISPFGLFYFFYYGPSVLIAKTAYDASETNRFDRYGYVKRVLLIILLQLVILIIIPPASGSPPPINIPLPIPGVVALLLTRVTVKELESPWEGISPDTGQQ